MDGGRRAVQLAPAVVADHDGVGAVLHGQARVLLDHDALEDQLAAPLLLHPGHVGPGQARVELLVGPGGQRTHVRHALHMPHQVAEGAPAGAGHAQAPLGLGHEVEDVGQRGLRRRGQAVLDVLVALADHLQVQREYQCAALGVLGALDHAGHGIAVTHHVQLEPERRAGVFGNVLDGADAHRGQRERNAELLGRARGVDLAIGMLHACEAHGRDAHGHLGLLPYQRGGRGTPFHVHRHALAQLNGVEVVFVGAVGALGPGARVGVVIEHARHAAFSDHAQVFDAGDFGQVGHGKSLGLCERAAPGAPANGRRLPSLAGSW